MKWCREIAIIIFKSQVRFAWNNVDNNEDEINNDYSAADDGDDDDNNDDDDDRWDNYLFNII